MQPPRVGGNLFFSEKTFMDAARAALPHTLMLSSKWRPACFSWEWNAEPETQEQMQVAIDCMDKRDKHVRKGRLCAKSKRFLLLKSFFTQYCFW
ncbi:hypothetical protein Peur_067631 [Populus x canadensis]